MTFVDTSFWVALVLARDRHNATAQALWRSRRDTLVTTNHVAGETWTFLRRRLGHRRAHAFLSDMRRSQRLVIRHIDEATEQAAWDWLRRHGEREYSFVDATSFALMRRLRLREALAFAGDFSAAGFVELRL